MTVEEMLKRADNIQSDAAMTNDALQSAALDLAQEQWIQNAALCERLDLQNALLERIALAMEGQIKP